MMSLYLRRNCSRILFNRGSYRRTFCWLPFKLEINSDQLNSKPKLLSSALARYSTKTAVTDKETSKEIGKDSQSEWIRIYTGSLSERMKLVKLFSLSTSIMGIVVQPMLLEKGTELGGTGVAVLICGVAGIFTFVTPVLLHLITKKYVVELDFNPRTDEYKATIISIILRRIEIKFRVSDVKVPEVPGMFTSFLVAKRPLFIEPTLFEDPDHYARIMGLDKPIDFKLNPNKIDNTTLSNTKK